MARILAVDNDPRTLAQIDAHLSPPEFDVVTATSGNRALEEAAQEDFDLILLDVHMPGMGGFEVCRRLKKKDRTKSVPVIFLSGEMRDTAARLQGFKTGAVDYILKPISNFELLCARIRVMLRVQAELREQVRKHSELEQRLQHVEESARSARREARELRRILELRRAEGPFGGAVLDGDLRVMTASEPFLELIGRTELQRPLDTDGDTVSARLRRILTGAVELPIVRGLLELEELSLEVRGLWVRPGELLYVGLTDVTDRRTAERELRQRMPAEPRHESPSRGATPSSRYRIPGFVGRSPVLDELTSAVEHLRHHRVTVLVCGESGTGKELVSRALHYGGPDAHKPFIPIHCGAISPNLIEAEFFGHMKGAFTGASGRKEGMFVAADGGTIFLDEIAETSMDLQVKLLRVLQNREVRPVGATHPLHVDVRVVAATNKDLVEHVRLGKFREDLFYRLEVVTVSVPPLRARTTDIPELVEHFIDAFNAAHRGTRTPVTGISQAALERLQEYDWPGNVRELENVIERVFALYPVEVIQEENLPGKILQPAREGSSLPLAKLPPVEIPRPEPGRGGDMDWKSLNDEAQRRMIQRALEDNGWNMGRAAAALRMSRSTFYRKCKGLGLRRKA